MVSRFRTGEQEPGADMKGDLGASSTCGTWLNSASSIPGVCCDGEVQHPEEEVGFVLKLPLPVCSFQGTRNVQLPAGLGPSYP